jgi:hypothetical protein
MDDPFFEVQLVDHMIVEETITLNLRSEFAESEVEVQKRGPVIPSEDKNLRLSVPVKRLITKTRTWQNTCPGRLLVVTLQPCDSRKKTNADSVDIMDGYVHLVRMCLDFA